jgi:hypothetical protein
VFAESEIDPWAVGAVFFASCSSSIAQSKRPMVLSSSLFRHGEFFFGGGFRRRPLRSSDWQPPFQLSDLADLSNGNSLIPQICQPVKCEVPIPISP